VLLVRTNLTNESLSYEVDALLAKLSEELVEAKVKETELRVVTTRQVQDDEGLAMTDDAAHAEIIDGRHLRRNVVVLKVLRHSGKLAALAEAKYGAGTTDVDDTLTTCTKRSGAILEDGTITRDHLLVKACNL
jgi:hypothetical protein